ncbi:MAG TPA: IS256 family transposase [Blastocatellia bacterium]|nr:IS256 family transposase [Blastocatellia bacterium]
MTKDSNPINLDLIDQLLKDYKSPEDVLGENGLLKQLTKAVLERALKAELTHHLGYDKHSPEGNNTGNSRNGKSSKTLKGDFGTLPLDVPRDRMSSFEPKIIPKGETRFSGFDDKILSLYARGMTVREIQAHLEEIYKVEVSPGLISQVTDEIIDEVRAWQTRPLERLYPILYLDALMVKVRDGAHVVNKALYLAIGVNLEGIKEVLGMWIANSEGAKFWLAVVTELRNRGVEDIFIACVDGLKGLPEAIEAVYPQAEVQQCIVHLVRQSLNYVHWKQRKEVASDLRRIYSAVTRQQAEAELEALAAKWDRTYPTISASWRRNWERVVVFLAYPQEIRKVIYTTNAIESVNRGVRKVIKNRGSFPNDEAAMKLIYLALSNISKNWSRPIAGWNAALNRFVIVFEGRLPI